MAKNCQRCGWALTDGNVVVESGDGCLGCAGLGEVRRSLAAAIETTQRAIAAAPEIRTAQLEAPRRHNATCPRCYGPAYHGFGYKPECERVGGCLADKEPSVFGMQDPRPAVPADVEARAYAATRGEVAWYLPALNAGPFASRGLAVAAWRETLLARAKRDAGL